MKKYIRHNRLIMEKVHDEFFIMDVNAGKYYALNSTASYLWQMLETPIGFDDLQRRMMMIYSVDERNCKDALANILNEMMGRFMVVLFDDES